jgi:hypothetical protein
MLGEGGGKPKDMYTRRVDVAPGARTKVTIDATPGSITLAVSVKTDKGAPIEMAQLITMATTIDPQTVEELRDGTNMPFGEQIIPIYLRGVIGGAATIEGMRPGPHTICALIGMPMPDTSSLKFKCTHATLTGAAKQAATLVVPAAWLAPAQP